MPSCTVARQATVCEPEYDDSKRPDVNGGVVFAVVNFRRHVLWGATGRVQFPADVCEAKVRKLDVKGVARLDKNIAWFDVAMHHWLVAVVQVRQCVEGLKEDR